MSTDSAPSQAPTEPREVQRPGGLGSGSLAEQGLSFGQLTAPEQAVLRRCETEFIKRGSGAAALAVALTNWAISTAKAIRPDQRPLARVSILPFVAYYAFKAGGMTSRAQCMADIMALENSALADHFRRQQEEAKGKRHTPQHAATPTTPAPTPSPHQPHPPPTGQPPAPSPPSQATAIPEMEDKYPPLPDSTPMALGLQGEGTEGVQGDDGDKYSAKTGGVYDGFRGREERQQEGSGDGEGRTLGRLARRDTDSLGGHRANPYGGEGEERARLEGRHRAESTPPPAPTITYAELRRRHRSAYGQAVQQTGREEKEGHEEK